MNEHLPPGMDAETMRRMATAAQNAIHADSWAGWVPQMLSTWATWFENAASVGTPATKEDANE